MSIKLFDSELNVMNVLWENGSLTAKKISDILAEKIGWNMNTTYTVIKKCIAKGAVERSEPNFMCRALISKEEVCRAEVSALADKLFDGATDKLFAALIDGREMSDSEIRSLKDMVEKLK